MDLRRLDNAIAKVEELVNEAMPEGEVQLVVAMNWRKARLEAAGKLVMLLERRAKLLGLDAPTGAKGAGDATDAKESNVVAAIRQIGKGAA